MSAAMTQWQKIFILACIGTLAAGIGIGYSGLSLWMQRSAASEPPFILVGTGLFCLFALYSMRDFLRDPVERKAGLALIAIFLIAAGSTVVLHASKGTFETKKLEDVSGLTSQSPQNHSPTLESGS